MKFVISLIKRILPKEIQRPLGRWRIEKCNTKMNSKIDLSNEDHCGPCGQYAIERISIKNDKNIEIPIQKTQIKP
jgi:hypothetical protein